MVDGHDLAARLNQLGGDGAQHRLLDHSRPGFIVNDPEKSEQKVEKINRRAERMRLHELGGYGAQHLLLDQGRPGFIERMRTKIMEKSQKRGQTVSKTTGEERTRGPS